MTNRQMTDKPRLVGHNLAGVTWILSKLFLDIVLGEHDSEISSLRVGDMNFDVFAATKHIPSFGIQGGKHLKGKAHRIVGKQSSRAAMGKADASNTTLLAQGFNDQRICHLPGKVENVRRLDGFDKLIGRPIASAPVNHTQERSGTQLTCGREKSINDIGLYTKVANETNALSFVNSADFQCGARAF